MEALYAKCNKSCGHKWYVKYFKKDKLSQGMEKTYFTCPHCQHDYVCFYTDEHIRQLQKKLRDIGRQLKWNTETDSALLQVQSSLRKEIKQRMDELKAVASDG